MRRARTGDIDAGAAPRLWFKHDDAVGRQDVMVKDGGPPDAARAATLALLARRAPGATVCPSEVARMLATDWRGAMPDVHSAVDAMVAEGVVRLSWKGEVLGERNGPYRIGRGAA